MKDVLLFVPGLLGTELHDADGKVWPGGLWGGVVGFNDAQFARLMKPSLTAGPIVEWAAGVVNIYARWLDAFRSLRRGGNQLFDDDATPPTLYTAPYDWRISLETSAKDRLAPAIRKIADDHGADVRIHIVAHSMGGLVTRYYLQSGKFDAEAGFSGIKSFITFGTPHNGAPVALAGALGIHKTTFLSLEQSKALANDPRYPSLYQTFPEPSMPVVWKQQLHGLLEPITLADHTFAEQNLGLNKATLVSAQAFRNSITTRPIPPSIRCFLLIGTRFDTITHMAWSNNKPTVVETPDSGDGTVSIPGAFMAGFQVQFTGESHVDQIKSDVARQSFQRLFDADGLMALVAGHVEMTVRDLDVSAQSGVHVRIYASQGPGLPDFDAQLVWERAAALPPGQANLQDKDFKPFGSTYAVPIKYAGPSAEAIAVKVEAPAMTGIYRLVLMENGGAIAKSQPFAVSP